MAAHPTRGNSLFSERFAFLPLSASPPAREGEKAIAEPRKNMSVSPRARGDSRACFFRPGYAARISTRTGRFHSPGMPLRERRRGLVRKNAAFVVSRRSFSDECSLAGRGKRAAACRRKKQVVRGPCGGKRTVHPLPPRGRTAGKSAQALRPMLNASSMAALPVTSPFFHTPGARSTPFSCTPSRQSVKPRKPSMVRSSAFLLPSAAVAMK